MTEENSCFFILTNYLNEALCRHCKFLNERPFPGLRRGEERSFKRGRSLNFSAVKRDVYLGRGTLSDDYGKRYNLQEIIKICKFTTKRK